MSGKDKAGIIPLTGIGGLGDPFGALIRADKALKDKKTGRSFTQRALATVNAPDVKKKVAAAEDQKGKEEAVDKYIRKDLRVTYKKLLTQPGTAVAQRAPSTTVRAAGPSRKYKPDEVLTAHLKATMPVDPDKNKKPPRVVNLGIGMAFMGPRLSASSYSIFDTTPTDRSWSKAPKK